MNNNEQAPLISPQTKLPEITLKAVILAVILAVLLSASNAYLALKVGTTVAASIPAAVISLAIFQLFRNSNVLESNLVQTAASAGEGLAAATTFILPALIILHYWSGFNFWETTFVTVLGGSLGVMFAVPLRRTLLGLRNLPFPEGTAIGNVLRAKASGGAHIKKLIQGSIAGGLVAFLQAGLECVSSYFPLWIKTRSLLVGTTLGFDPVLIGAGYIIGINANLAMFLGTFAGWIVGVPVLCLIYGMPSGGDHYDQVMNLWDQHIRYIGVGTMMIAGVWTLFTLIKPLVNGISTTFTAMRQSHLSQIVLRTEKDIPLHYVLMGILFLLLCCFILIFYIVHTSLAMSLTTTTGISLIAVLAILFLGFLSALICGYLVGLIGSTNTPLSGILIINVLILSLLLFPLLRLHLNLDTHAMQQAAIAIIVFITTIIGTAAVITNENIQDLKAGQMVGATPWKQQLMMLIGAVVSSFAIAPVLELLFQAYGMGGVFPRVGMSSSQMLPAPQAGLIAALAQGVMGHSLPWGMLIAGGIIAIICIVLDEYIKKYDYRLPVLAVGLGIYLPPEIIIPSVIGGLTHYFATHAMNKRVKSLPTEEQNNAKRQMSDRGVLLACGLVAGAALMGVILAVPFVIKGNADVLKIVGDNFTPVANILGAVITVMLCYWLYRTASFIKNK